MNDQQIKKHSNVTIIDIETDNAGKQHVHNDEDMQQAKMDNTQNSEMTKLTKNMTQVWETFIATTTLHGSQQILGFSRQKARGIIWSMAILFVAACLVTSVIALFMDYVKYPTRSNIQQDIREELPFPAVTVCNLSPYSQQFINLSDALTTFFLTSSNLGIFENSINFSDPSFSELTEAGTSEWFQRAANRLKSILLICVYKTDIVMCQDAFVERSTDWGICFTFNSWEHAKKANRSLSTSFTGSNTGLTLYMAVDQNNYVFSENLAAGLKVVLHEPYDEPNVRDEGFVVSPGFSTYAVVKLTKYKFLPYPYKAFASSYCVEKTDPLFNKKLLYHEPYSYYACIRECKLKYVTDRCGCKDHKDFGNTTICSFQKILSCYKMKQHTFDLEMDAQKACKCVYPCHKNTFSAQLSMAYFPSNINADILKKYGYQNLRQNYLELRIFYDSLLYTTVHQMPIHTLDSIIATLGGNMGLFIGASLLTLSEIFELIITMFFMLLKKIFARKKLFPQPKS